MSTLTEDMPGSDKDRRRFLIAATTVVGTIGAAGLLVPFIASMNPSARALNAGAPVKVDFSKLEPGQQLTVVWQGKPIWVLRRTPDMLKRLTQQSLLNTLTDPDSHVISQQPEYAHNKYRAIDDEYFVTIALCTHLGCVPNFRPDIGPEDLGAAWPGGYFCPCHGSRFDFAGRVYKGVPAPTNLVIPPYQFLSDTEVEIGTSAQV